MTTTATRRTTIDHEILALDDDMAAIHSLWTDRPVLWTCGRPPRALAGLLADDISGAWVEPGRVVVRIGGRETSYALEMTGNIHACLRRVLRLHLEGARRDEIEAGLATSAAPAA